MGFNAEGAYDPLKSQIVRYGGPLDPTLRDQVVERYGPLNLPTYWAGINPELRATIDAHGNATAVTMTYPRDPVRQYLRYGAMWSK
jgi:hypothetical protein